MNHPLIDSKMFEINWLTLGKWDASGRASKLSGVVLAIVAKMREQEPTIEYYSSTYLFNFLVLFSYKESIC